MKIDTGSMGNINQDNLEFMTLNNLIREIENIIISQYLESNILWTLFTELGEMFNRKTGMSLKDTLLFYGYEQNWKSFFIKNKSFSVYSIQSYEEFYVSLLKFVVPNFQQHQQKPITYKIKKPWRSDGRLIKMLIDEGAVEVSTVHPKLRHSKDISDYKYNKPINPPIMSIEQLENALVQVIICLVEKSPEKFTTVKDLSRSFFEAYNQPIRSLMTKLLPEMSLIELIQTIPELDTQQINGTWQIFIAQI